MNKIKIVDKYKFGVKGNFSMESNSEHQAIDVLLALFFDWVKILYFEILPISYLQIEKKLTLRHNRQIDR